MYCIFVNPFEFLFEWVNPHEIWSVYRSKQKQKQKQKEKEKQKHINQTETLTLIYVLNWSRLSSFFLVMISIVSNSNTVRGFPFSERIPSSTKSPKTVSSGPSHPSKMPDNSRTRLCCSKFRFTWSMCCATFLIISWACTTSGTSQCLRRF